MVVLGMKQKDTRQQYMQDMQDMQDKQDVQQLPAAITCSSCMQQLHAAFQQHKNTTFNNILQ